MPATPNNVGIIAYRGPMDLMQYAAAEVDNDGRVTLAIAFPGDGTLYRDGQKLVARMLGDLNRRTPEARPQIPVEELPEGAEQPGPIQPLPDISAALPEFYQWISLPRKWERGTPENVLVKEVGED